jgi:hypothetical protein
MMICGSEPSLSYTDSLQESSNSTRSILTVFLMLVRANFRNAISRTSAATTQPDPIR